MDLTINNLSYSYYRNGPDVLSDITVSFTEGGVIGLLGPNGAGKSTLLYLMAGALTPSDGSVMYDGISTRRRLPSVLSSIFLVQEEPQLPKMTLEMYIRLYSVFYPSFDRSTMEMALKEFQIDGLFEKNPKHSLDSLSMGQKKKVFLSFAFACHTPVLLLDEPTNGLDIPGKAAFRRLTAQLASDDKLMIISTHQVRDLDTILDRVIIMDDSNLLINESIADIQRRLAFYNGILEVPATAIYSIPSPAGFQCVVPNAGDEDTEVNLEILFEAVTKHPDLIRSVFVADHA